MSGKPRTLFRAEEIAELVRRLGAEISADHPEGLALVGVLKGSVCLVADLARAIDVPCVLDFLALSAYAGGSARVRILKDIDIDVRGLDVVLVEDVIDTGLSSGYVVGLLAQRGARRVEVCALLDRPARRILPVPLRYVGAEVPDDFLVGYGLDAAERYRNLPGIHVVDPARLDEERAPVEAALYGNGAAYPTPLQSG